MSKNNDMDRIRLLPDSLLHDILSFLDTKQVVQTCVLSKRWKTLWTHIPTLNFDFNSFLDRGKIKNALDNGIQFDVKGHLQSKGTSFKRFILEVLSQHSSNSITKLSYSFPSRIEEDFVTKVLCYEQCRWVQEFYIATYNADEPISWASLSACKLLIVLKITCRHVDNLGSLVLPCLRILEIKRVFDFRYWNDYFLPYNCMQSYNNYYGDIGLNENTFSGCPNLECLVLFDCILYAACICAPKLEKLELMALFHAFTFPEVELCIPNLKSVKFSNVIPCELKCCSDIVNIHQVSIAFDYCDFGRELCLLQQRVVKNICELLKVFHDLVSLILPPNTTQAIFKAPSLSGLSFQNLRYLKEFKAKRTEETIEILVDSTI